jgi:hypothetical protein
LGKTFLAFFAVLGKYKRPPGADTGVRIADYLGIMAEEKTALTNGSI